MQIYPIPNHATLPDMPSATNTDHDGRYYTESEIDTMLGDGTIDHGNLAGLTGQGAGGGANDHGLGSDDSPSFAGITLGGLTLTTDVDVGNYDLTAKNFIGDGYGRFDAGLGVGVAPTGTVYLNVTKADATTVAGAIQNTTAGGDSQLNFLVVGNDWSIGIDNSVTNDPFVIAYGLDLAVTPIATFDGAAGNITFGTNVDLLTSGTGKYNGLTIATTTNRFTLTGDTGSAQLDIYGAMTIDAVEADGFKIWGGDTATRTLYVMGGDIFLNSPATGNLGIGDTNTLGSITATSGNYNIGVGAYAGASITTSDYNIYEGYEAGRYNTGEYNTAIGYQALKGVDGSSTGDSNFALGALAGLALTSGSNNIFIGDQAGTACTICTTNVFIGTNSGAANTNRINLVGVGYSTFNSNTTGSGCVAIGRDAMSQGTDPEQGVAIGFDAGRNYTGDHSTFIGNESGYSATSALRNIFIGAFSGWNQTTEDDLLIIDRGLAAKTERADKAAEIANSIVYGVMADAAANQTLRLNALVGIGKTPTAGSALDINLSTEDLEVIDAKSTETTGTAAGWIKTEIGGNVRYIQTYSDVPS